MNKNHSLLFQLLNPLKTKLTYGFTGRRLFRRLFIPLCVVLAAALVFVSQVHSSDPVKHKVAIHVDDNDPKRMNMALNNIVNLRKYYDSVGEEVEIELVAYGPGLHMLRADTSPVADRISVMSLEMDGLTFSACGNTHNNMSKQAGHDVELLDEASLVPSGVVQLIHLQEIGYAYVRP